MVANMKENKMFKVRRIELPELRKLHLAHPDFVDCGWAVVELDEDIEVVVDWFANKYAADQDTALRNEEAHDG